MEEQNNNIKKRGRDDSDELSADSTEVKRLRDNLLDLLDDYDPDPAAEGLDSVMKSFADEISPASSSQLPAAEDLVSDSAESHAELASLLELSDDELGLPPSAGQEEEGADLVRGSSGASGIDGNWRFEDEFPSYDSVEFGSGDDSSNKTEFMAFNELFEFSSVNFEAVPTQQQTEALWTYDL